MFTPAQMSGRSSQNIKKSEKPEVSWRDKAIWSEIPEYHRDRVKNQFEKDWGSSSAPEQKKLLKPYIDN